MRAVVALIGPGPSPRAPAKQIAGRKLFSSLMLLTVRTENEAYALFLGLESIDACSYVAARVYQMPREAVNSMAFVREPACARHL